MCWQFYLLEIWFIVMAHVLHDVCLPNQLFFLVCGFGFGMFPTENTAILGATVDMCAF